MQTTLYLFYMTQARLYEVYTLQSIHFINDPNKTRRKKKCTNGYLPTEMNAFAAAATNHTTNAISEPKRVTRAVVLKPLVHSMHLLCPLPPLW